MATFLLIHGSFQGGWIWQPTAKALRANGHTVYAPTMGRLRRTGPCAARRSYDHECGEGDGGITPL